MDIIALFTKLVKSSPDLIEEIKEENKSMPIYEIHHGINEDLPLQLLTVYKARVDDL